MTLQEWSEDIVKVIQTRGLFVSNWVVTVFDLEVFRSLDKDDAEKKCEEIRKSVTKTLQRIKNDP